ncbi:Fumarylacetoacetate hydrolase domain-containing protein 2 [Hondaea fermentalgiana]|uniref:Fumarylacetoacetate hydrolase domain-containing protein 2 n=1 Tax=Hondaea fermentalgiana TaxID=2315210 RepID=A0A2R5G0A5_9STRA|nr:Fumarylacetoacetate hydrolase domain-containing protein 2 [Hondaea fermentalgiana]|eukprot:GBG24466.1 Fumarylacetoacetate hydrolase domain-containing protein 2 [Hondaea fermentalgiana]
MLLCPQGALVRLARRSTGQGLWAVLESDLLMPSMSASAADLRAEFEKQHFGAVEWKEPGVYVEEPGRIEHNTDYTLSALTSAEVPCVWAAGLNYRKHAEETNMEVPRFPTLFMKATSSLNGPFGDIKTPAVCNHEMDFEGELAVVIGKGGKDISVENAMDHVLGFTIAHDVSARRWQGRKGGGQWCRSKSFDTFLPLGPGIVPVGSLPDGGQSLRIQTTLSRPGAQEKVVQDSSTADLIFGVPELISFISQDTTLEPFTVILTGTPEGVGFTRDPPLFMEPGDVVTVSIEGLGTIRNRVA